MDKFKTRKPIESVTDLNKNEDVEKLRLLLNELADLGWNSNQWSDMLPDDDDPRMLALHPEFKNWDADQRSDYLFNTDVELPKDFFIESFGNETYGYLRAEGSSLVICAEKLLRRAKQQISCSHTWSYTHSNGNKTCTSCGAFTKCTTSEAVSNYEVGNVKIDEHLTLYFNNKRSICSCGSNKVYGLEDSMFFETDYICPSCNTYLPTKFKDSEHSSLPVDPNNEDYEEASFTTEKSMFDRQRIRTLSVVPEGLMRQLIHRYIVNMLKHYNFVLKGRSIPEFIVWLKPYLLKTASNINSQVKIEGKKMKFKGIKNLEINEDKEKGLSIQYDIVTGIPEKEAEDFDVTLKNVLGAISGKQK